MGIRVNSEDGLLVVEAVLLLTTLALTLIRDDRDLVQIGVTGLSEKDTAVRR